MKTGLTLLGNVLKRLKIKVFDFFYNNYMFFSGIREQGIYRNCGVTSKVQRLMQLALDKKKSSAEKLNLTDDTEWETKTISSAIKTFLRNLPEPLMTFDLHHHFINAAKMDDVVQRVNHIHYYVYKLPEVHRHMLELIIKHLKKFFLIIFLLILKII